MALATIAAMEGLPLKVSLALGDAAVLHMSVPCGALQTAVLDNLDAILQLGLSHSMAMGVSPEEALRFNEALGAARTAPSEAPCTPERQPRRSRSRTPPKVESQNSSISGLKAELARYGVDTSRCLEKKDLEELLKKCQSLSSTWHARRESSCMVFSCVRISRRAYVCMYACMDVCMFVCMYVCMYVCICMYVYSMYTYIN